MTFTDELLCRATELARKYNVGIHVRLSGEILESLLNGGEGVF